jgi:sirohydrochlorin ferrochelatase
MRYPQLSPPPGEDHAWPPPLVVAAHGSTDPRAAATVTDLARLVQARACRAGLPGLTVRAAYLGHALPSVPDALEALHGDGRSRAVVLPLLLTEAYHSDTDLPAVLRAAGRRLPGLRLAYGRPLGPHPLLLRALERRLAEAGASAAADTAVVLAAAGSSRPAANAAVARAARAWRGWRRVVPAYASAASPAPAQAVGLLRQDGAPRVVVATYLLAPGVFADQVRGQSLAAGADAVSAALGAAPEVADIVIERYVQAAAQRAPVSAGRRAFAIAPDDGEMGPRGDAHDAAGTACHA